MLVGIQFAFSNSICVVFFHAWFHVWGHCLAGGVKALRYLPTLLLQKAGS